MTENKRYTWNSEDVVINDNVTGKQLEVVDITEIDVLLDLLNEQDERIKELETVIQQILYETRANYTKEEYSATISISPQMHDKLTELITEVK